MALKMLTKSNKAQYLNVIKSIILYQNSLTTSNQNILHYEIEIYIICSYI